MEQSLEKIQDECQVQYLRKYLTKTLRYPLNFQKNEIMGDLWRNSESIAGEIPEKKSVKLWWNHLKNGCRYHRFRYWWNIKKSIYKFLQDQGFQFTSEGSPESLLKEYLKELLEVCLKGFSEELLLPFLNGFLRKTTTIRRNFYSKICRNKRNLEENPPLVSIDFFLKNCR